MTHLDLVNLSQGRVTLLNAADPGRDRDVGDHLPDAVIDALTAGVPVVYVECGGYEGWASELLAHIGPDPRFRVLDDEDDVIWLPDLTGGGVEDLCYVGTPTFSRADRTVLAHAETFGSGILILDAIERARPYAGIDEHPADAVSLVQRYLTLECLSAVTPSQVCSWRANDLRRLVRRYPGTRVLAITYDNTVAERLAPVAVPFAHPGLPA